ncbi:tyrosine-type recombinase/integrase [Gymnodinialimonas ceratoperidinii]|uniref:Tyrosine-type recombinase/integrase n=1 Tax=Gymnodinialimonas ceratoperidinii TaxID=2856823 RepID=A0A8F6TUX6_9RHOB|nr:site-specific integrase [Gymnodinialimonas ceratoperidinii]QXT39432.1 tyrosine-type recombinase/integrase [Gymnodinialimonas ceratoperidinii]
MKKVLTTKLLNSLDPGEKNRIEVRDAKMQGFGVRVYRTGRKVFDYKCRVDGRRLRIAVGTYPLISLAEARQKATQIARDVALGVYAAKDDLPVEATPTLREVVDQFIDLYAKPNTKDWRGSQSILRKFRSLFDRPIDEIRRRDVVAVLDSIIASGTPTRANRALAAIKKLMNWCVDRGMIEVSPIAALKPPSREYARDRVLTDQELIAIWNAAEGEGYPFEQFIKMLLLTGQRRGEVAGMRWSEIFFEDGIWTLPGARVKNSQVHMVPLPEAAIDLLHAVPRFIDSDLVFTTNGRNPVSGFGRLKRRLDAALPDDTADWRFHDFRRTASTGMAKLGVLPHVIDAVTNHKSGVVSGVGATYNRYTYLTEKRHALEQWAQVVGSLGKDHKLEPHN